MPHRILKFDNVLNVRDFGGHEIAGGRKVVLGKLFRGAQLSKMAQNDIEKFVDLRIDLIVDLRYLPERKRQATVLTTEFSPKVMAFLAEHDQKDSDALAPHEAFAIRELHTADDAFRYMLGSYEKRPHDPGFVDLCARSLRQMSRTGDSVYVHCAAGKDRTGTFCAIFLMLMGVRADDVMAEYMRTQQAIDLDLVLSMIAMKMSERYGRQFAPEALRPYFDVAPDYLHKSLQKIGNIETYAREVLHLDDDTLVKLKAHYTK